MSFDPEPFISERHLKHEYFDSKNCTLKWHKTVFRSANITDISEMQTMFNSMAEIYYLCMSIGIA